MGWKKDTLVNGGLYALAGLGTAYAVAAGSHTLEFICKPLLMIVLSSWFFFNTRKYGDRFTLMIQIGLFFSLIGDIALMFQYVDDFFFVIGLGAFLLVQLFYAIAFVRNIGETPGIDGLWLSSAIALSIVLAAIGFGWNLIPRLDDRMVGPVTFYIIAIASMGVLAAFRYMRTYPRSFWLVLFGAALFIVSDMVLATNRFLRPLSWGPPVTIITYALAQFLIAAGCLVHVLAPDTIRRKKALEV
jgi:uncharacterized membrane protein YhhN